MHFATLPVTERALLRTAPALSVVGLGLACSIAASRSVATKSAPTLMSTVQESAEAQVAHVQRALKPFSPMQAMLVYAQSGKVPQLLDEPSKDPR